MRTVCHLSATYRELEKGVFMLQEVKTAERAEAPAQQQQEQQEGGVPGTEDEQEIGKTVVNEQGETIYLGFDKSDTDPRTGRKGRTITDDAERYPSRSELVGGWAGGEVGLQQFVEVAGPSDLSPTSFGSPMHNCAHACSACMRPEGAHVS